MVDLTELVTVWTARYEDAWRAPGTDLLAGLFTPDATYRPAPFAEPVRGLAAIARLWEAERSGPDEPFTMTAEPVAASDGRAVVRVEVRYGPPTNAQYRDLWIVHLREDGRCHSFEEWPFWPPGTSGAIAGSAR